MESLKKLMIVIFICSSNNISGKIGTAKKIFRSFERSEFQAHDLESKCSFQKCLDYTGCPCTQGTYLYF